MQLKVASFFAGIGGLELGFEQAGFKTAFQCEVKPFCLDILEKHWPDTPKIADIREVTNAAIPISDVWTAGFPCQDLSLARMGARSGLRGPKSGLFHEFMRIVREGMPRAIVLENVFGLLSSHGGRDFAIVLKALDELGYGVAWRVLDSKYFGVPQQRRRVYIVAVHRDPHAAAKILFEPECCNRDTASRGQDGKKPASLFQTVLGNPRKGPLVKSIAHCVYAESARHTGTDWSRNYVWYPNGRVRRFTPNELEQVQGFPEDWTMPLDAHGYSEDRLDSLRYHAVGNSVTPQVAKWVGHRAMEVLSELATSVLNETVKAPKNKSKTSTQSPEPFGIAACAAA